MRRDRSISAPEALQLREAILRSLLEALEAHMRKPPPGSMMRPSYMDELEVRIAELSEREELLAMRPDLDGTQVMAHLGIPPSRDVGQALDFLLELRLDEGPLGEEEAFRRLDEWWAARQAPGT